MSSHCSIICWKCPWSSIYNFQEVTGELHDKKCFNLHRTIIWCQIPESCNLAKILKLWQWEKMFKMETNEDSIDKRFTFIWNIFHLEFWPRAVAQGADSQCYKWSYLGHFGLPSLVITNETNNGYNILPFLPRRAVASHLYSPIINVYIAISLSDISSLFLLLSMGNKWRKICRPINFYYEHQVGYKYKLRLFSQCLSFSEAADICLIRLQVRIT